MAIHSQRSTLADLVSLFRSTNRGLAFQIGSGAVGSVALKTTYIGLSFATSVMLARILGAEGYGTYAYVLSIAYVLAIPAQFGLPKLVVRETAKAHVQEDWGLMRGVWRWSSLLALGMTVILGLAALVVAWVTSAHLSHLQLLTFLWGIALVPLVAFNALRGAALQGLRRVVLGNIPTTIIRPLLLIFSVSIVIFIAGKRVTAAQAMALTVCSTAIAFLIGAWWLRRSRPAGLRIKPKPIYHSRLWLAAILPFALTAGMQQINQYTDILMLGAFRGASEAGIYRVAVQNALLIAFGLQVADMFIAPYFARLYAQADSSRLQRLVSLSGKMIFILALPPFITFAIWGETLLGIIFGQAYRAAYFPLLILAIGQLANAAFGSVGFLLNMTGHERDTLFGIGIAAVANVIFNLVLIPQFGMIGAAVATALSLITWNLLLWRATHRRLGLETFVMANFFNRQ